MIQGLNVAKKEGEREFLVRFRQLSFECTHRASSASLSVLQFLGGSV